MRLFLGYLRATVALQCSPAEAPNSSTASLLQQYENHLRKDRGLAENSLRVYLPLIQTLLASKFAGSGFPQSLRALTIRDFVIAQTRIGLRSTSAFYRQHCGRLAAFSFFSAICQSTSLLPCPEFANTAMPLRPHSSDRKKLRVRLRQWIERRPGTSGLRDPAAPCQAWSARRRDRFAGTGRYLLADRRDRRPWEGPNDRAFAPPAGYRRSPGRLPSQGSWRQQITTGLPANVGAAHRSDGSSGSGPHCAPGAGASGDSALRSRCRPPVPPRLSNADDSPWRLSAGDCGSSSPSFPNDHFRLHPGGIRGIA